MVSHGARTRRTVANSQRARLEQLREMCLFPVIFALRYGTRRSGANLQRAREQWNARSAQTSLRVSARRKPAALGTSAKQLGEPRRFRSPCSCRRLHDVPTRRLTRRGVLGRVRALGSGTRNLRRSRSQALEIRHTSRPQLSATQQPYRELGKPSQRCARQRSSSPPWRGTRTPQFPRPP